MSVFLASASPRRRELLALLLKDFSCFAPNIDESIGIGECPEDYVQRMAREKAATRITPNALVVAADTSVVFDNQVLGKPAGAEDAQRMLECLSGKTHRVLTAVSVGVPDRLDVALCETRVTFAPLSRREIALYLATDEPWDKAGSYGIQGKAGSFVTSIEGSYSAVVGLPLAETRALLAGHGVLPEW